MIGKDLPKDTHLVIHLDINETILIGDNAGGDTSEESLHKILAKSAFVRIPDASVPLEEQEPKYWWDGSLIQESYSLEDSVPSLFTGWSWPEGCCPYYRTKYKEHAKRFANYHGSIYKETYSKLKEAISWTSHGDHDIFQKHDVLHHLLPALFQTLEALSSLDRPYSIVFRTMGSDLSDIASAVNVFASGGHPAYPSFRDPSLVLPSDQLYVGRWKEGSNFNDAVYQLWQGDSLLANDDQEALDILHQNKIVGIQDDYHFWNKNNYAPWSGKPVWKLSGQQSFHHVLFDDNIHNLDDDSIACIRHQCEDGTFVSLSGAEVLMEQGIHLVRVPTVDVVLDANWFVSKLGLGVCS